MPNYGIYSKIFPRDDAGIRRWSIGDTILSGKYQLCRVIGRGRTGTVYLGLHKELEEYRAIKAVAKSSVRYEAFRKEALLLKELRHPGIPIVYDIEEDDAYSYLVEEYLQGNSLESLVESQGPLARRTVLEYAIQICGVVNYLHSAGIEPILHLDLQPKNLLVCHEMIKLVDFGQAAMLTEANQAVQRFGTAGFAAPEQYDCEMDLDERTDIFAIGGLLFYLATGTYPDKDAPPASLGLKLWSREAGRILAACLEPVKECRYASVSQLENDLENLKDGAASSLAVAVYGLEPCVGTTHISLALAAFLWEKGIPNLYEECHPSDHIRRLARRQRLQADSFGIFSVFGCAVKPCYGRQARFSQHHYPVTIQDRGVWGKKSHEERGGVCGEQQAEICLLVAGGKWWNRELYGEEAKSLPKRTIILYNFSHQKIRVKMPQGLEGKTVLRVPLFSNPFCLEGSSREWLGFLWDLAAREDAGLFKGRIKPFGKRKNHAWKSAADAAGRVQEIRERIRQICSAKGSGNLGKDQADMPR